MTKPRRGGYTLIELMVSIGLFAIIMTLVAGAYLMIIGISRQAEGISTAVDGVSYALEDMSRTIRTGTGYGCGLIAGIDCPAGGSTFSLTDQSGAVQTFSLQNGVIYQDTTPLTDPSITVTALTFYVSGTKPASQGDYAPPYVTIVISGTIVAGKQTFPFTVETSAVMRGIDL
jgi:prepilin-type N-terminal cleavage/methylation domain-containing protein